MSQPGHGMPFSWKAAWSGCAVGAGSFSATDEGESDRLEETERRFVRTGVRTGREGVPVEVPVSVRLSVGRDGGTSSSMTVSG